MTIRQGTPTFKAVHTGTQVILYERSPVPHPIVLRLDLDGGWAFPSNILLI
jgi:hypothetical protein